MLRLQFCGLTGLVIFTANLLKYFRVFKIEGEIALLSPYYNAIIVTRHIIEELTEKEICTHCALSISRKKNN